MCFLFPFDHLHFWTVSFVNYTVCQQYYVWNYVFEIFLGFCFVSLYYIFSQVCYCLRKLFWIVINDRKYTLCNLVKIIHYFINFLDLLFKHSLTDSLTQHSSALVAFACLDNKQLTRCPIPEVNSRTKRVNRDSLL